MTNQNSISAVSIPVNVKTKHTDRSSSLLRGSISPVGKFFLSYHADGIVRWQGQILAEVSPGRYRIQLFEWLTGSSSDQLVVSTRSMRGWTFYDSADAWHEASRIKTGARPLHTDSGQPDSPAPTSIRIFVLTPSNSKGATP